MALKGLRVIEMAGLAPVPFCGMLLSDFGARVIRVDNPGSNNPPDLLDHGKESITINLKNQDGLNAVKRLCQQADILIEPFRPGVMEKLGLGPNVLMTDNPQLIYARLTGYGQEGSMALKAGHDINYIAMSGVLSKLGRRGENPHPHVNILADFAGGGLLCAFGILAALQARNKHGQGQVIDANMVEGSAYLASWLDASKFLYFQKEKGSNFLDGGSAFYDTYKTKDGKFMAVGSLEPQFYANLLKGLGLDKNETTQFDDQDEQRKLFAKIFLTKSREEWTEVFNNLDACVTPVLDTDEAAEHDHNKSKGSFKTSENGQRQANPAPRLSLTQEIRELRPQPKAGQHNQSVLYDFGFTKQEIADLIKSNAFGQVSSKL